MHREIVIPSLLSLGLGLAACASREQVSAVVAAQAFMGDPPPVVEPASIKLNPLTPTPAETATVTPVILTSPTLPVVEREATIAVENFSNQEETFSTKELAELFLNPRSGAVIKSKFFTSRCFGPNPLEREDFLTPLDWWVSRADRANTHCDFGFTKNSGSETGKYSVGEFQDLPLYYLIPPKALDDYGEGPFVLSEISLIDDPAPYAGWEKLGNVYLSIDGTIFWGPAKEFFRPGGEIGSVDGTKTIKLPQNDSLFFKQDSEGGGNHGVAGFPLAIAERELVLAFTGEPGGGPPPRTYFSTRINEIDPKVKIKTTSALSNQELSDFAGDFDEKIKTADRAKEREKFEESLPTPYPEISLRAKEEADFEFSAKSGTTLSSIRVFMWPGNNNGNQDILENNIDVYVDGELVYPGTGFEDFGGGAFYSGGITPVGAFFPIDHDGYLAARNFDGPVIHEGKVSVRVKNADVGTSVRLRVEVQVIAAK